MVRESMHDNEVCRIILVGFGGMAMELLDYLQVCRATTNFRNSMAPLTRDGEVEIAYIDDQDRSDRSSKLGIANRGKIVGYVPRECEWLIVTVGDPGSRARLWESMRETTGRFASFIHPSAIVSPTAKIGDGVVVGPMAMINAGAIVGDNVLVNCYASVSHGAVVGDHSVLSPYVSVLGDARIGRECLLGSKASVFPRVAVGDRCIIDAHSYAKMDVPEDHIIRCRTEYQVIRNRLAQSGRKL
jgi:sugar O-acyltransferase (sialic acid O-acetyltransferase NeuD family)